MQALVRVQARVRARRLQLVQEKLESKLEEARRHANEQKQQHKHTSPIKNLETEGWDNRNQSMDKIQESSRRKYDAEMKRERALSYAFAYQVSYNSSYYLLKFVFITHTIILPNLL